MRRFSFMVVMMLLGASPAFAQAYYAEQTYPTAVVPQAAIGSVYAGQPTYAPQPNRGAPQAPAEQAPASANQPRPSDYGQSVITDIRQMNF
jgi:hypothetical protein